MTSVTIDGCDGSSPESFSIRFHVKLSSIIPLVIPRVS